MAKNKDILIENCWKKIDREKNISKKDLYTLASVFSNKCYTGELCRILELIYKKEKNTDILKQIAKKQTEAEMYGQAVKTLKRLLKIRPDDYETCWQLSELYKEFGDGYSILFYMKKAIELELKKND
ncbi:hypothetical protein IKQ21_02940 [bacterium]|nr:hypothetical protein [bacterium]